MARNSRKSRMSKESVDVLVLDSHHLEGSCPSMEVRAVERFLPSTAEESVDVPVLDRHHLDSPCPSMEVRVVERTVNRVQEYQSTETLQHLHTL